jgi:EAL domain-containing protein (putative c-di-GMP-specific phosphodiesterase class I)
MINEMGKSVLEMACREAVSWAVPAKISVNVSPVQLSSKAFAGVVLSILNETGLPADRLELEVTESSLFSESNTPMNTLNKLKALGVKISIDDFGTGYSSLSRLSRLAFDKIKIDKSFVHSLATQEDALNIIKLITGMAKSLNMKAVAEGVETREQLESLQALGCDFAQGYLFGKPQLIVVYQLAVKLAAGGVTLLAVGGVIYSLGVIFYVCKRIPYNHAIWHGFVLGGSVCHFLAIYLYVGQV